MILGIAGAVLVCLGFFCVWIGPRSVDPHAGDGGFGLGVFLLGFVFWAIGTLLLALEFKWWIACISLALLLFVAFVANPNERRN